MSTAERERLAELPAKMQRASQLVSELMQLAERSPDQRPIFEATLGSLTWRVDLFIKEASYMLDKGPNDAA
jgi:hypothetical protein